MSVTFSRRPKKCVIPKGSLAHDGWWYEDRHGIDVVSESTCSCGRIRTVTVRVRWHQLAAFIRRKLGRVVL